jgi:hypothetical protein
MLVLILNFQGCVSKHNEIIIVNERIEEFSHKYQNEYEIEMLAGVSNEFESVLTYEEENVYGMIIFYENKEFLEINYKESNCVRNNNLEKVYYTQVQGTENNYLGVLINDETFINKIKSIKIVFAEETGKANALEKTLNGSKSMIISYENDAGLREIDEIILRNENGQEIYNLKEL